MPIHRPSRRLAPLAVAAGLSTLAAAGLPEAALAAKRPCTRGGATIDAASRQVLVVRRTARPQSSRETRRERVLACWRKTGRRVRIAEEVDFGLDNVASTTVEIVGGRYVGVIERNEGGVSGGAAARVYDARRARLLHTSRECDAVEQGGDFSGVEDVAFLRRGGMAFSCDRLHLYRSATAPLETLEPAGTDVRQIAVSRHTRDYRERLFWTVATAQGEQVRWLDV